jgi:hypothetical protein
MRFGRKGMVPDGEPDARSYGEQESMPLPKRGGRRRSRRGSKRKGRRRHKR